VAPSDRRTTSFRRFVEVFQNLLQLAVQDRQFLHLLLHGLQVCPHGSAEPRPKGPVGTVFHGIGEGSQLSERETE
jgi:hypothetical protein